MSLLGHEEEPICEAPGQESMCELSGLLLLLLLAGP